jgi:hypothetical protein
MIATATSTSSHAPRKKGNESDMVNRPPFCDTSAPVSLVASPANGGTPPPSAPPRWGAPWTQAEVDAMLKMVRERRRQTDIAAALCRTLGAIKIKLAQVRRAVTIIQSRASPGSEAEAALRRRRWSRSETEALRMMIARGWGDARIANALDRTAEAISVRRSRLRTGGDRKHAFNNDASDAEKLLASN